MPMRRHTVLVFTLPWLAGPLLAGELKALGQALNNPARPMVAIVGGSKVSTKLTVLESLTQKVDQLIPGGGIANTFIAAAGFSVGQSLVETDLIGQAKKMMDNAVACGREIPVPTDVVVGKMFSADAKAIVMRPAQLFETHHRFLTSRLRQVWCRVSNGVRAPHATKRWRSHLIRRVESLFSTYLKSFYFLSSERQRQRECTTPTGPHKALL